MYAIKEHSSFRATVKYTTCCLCAKAVIYISQCYIVEYLSCCILWNCTTLSWLNRQHLKYK